jgi:hypothetical protein
VRTGVRRQKGFVSWRYGIVISTKQIPLNSIGKLSFPAGILNFESSCGVCDSWGWARVGRRDCGWSGDDGCLLGEAGDRGLAGAVCLAQR